MNKLVRMSLPIALVLAIGPQRGDAEPSPSDCSVYARNQAEMNVPQGAGAIGGAARGSATGAVIGGIAGGWHGAGRGAAWGAGLGAVGGSARATSDRQAQYRYYYDACMEGRRY